MHDNHKLDFAISMAEIGLRTNLPLPPEKPPPDTAAAWLGLRPVLTCVRQHVDKEVEECHHLCRVEGKEGNHKLTVGIQHTSKATDGEYVVCYGQPKGEALQWQQEHAATHTTLGGWCIGWMHFPVSMQPHLSANSHTSFC
jgi:hypothetical protein